MLVERRAKRTGQALWLLVDFVSFKEVIHCTSVRESSALQAPSSCVNQARALCEVSQPGLWLLKISRRMHRFFTECSKY